MGVDLFLVFCLDNEDDLDGDEVERVVLLWEHQLRRCIDGELGGVLRRDQTRAGWTAKRDQTSKM